jgi:hypothetical protein
MKGMNMWPLKEKRRKKRRKSGVIKKQKIERRDTERRKDLNWMELYLDDDEPEIS